MRNRPKKYLRYALFFAILLPVLFYFFPPVATVKKVKGALSVPDHILKIGGTVKDRVKLIEGFERVPYATGSFEQYLRNFKLKTFGNKIINYDGKPYFYQMGHVGILDVSVPDNGLQQCADALIRLRSEYLWENNQKDNIGFEFTSGHYCSWKKYAAGYRPKINGNQVAFSKTANADTSKANFYNYLNLIFAYSGTLSLEHELDEIKSVNALKIGDMILVGGSPGHVVMIADIIENNAGDRRFLLMQGNTPAQSVHLLKNLEDSAISPWYKLQFNTNISTPGYTFVKPKFVRFK